MINAQSIGASYSGKTALKDVSLQLNPRETTVFIGPNGCGKSTLLRIMAGIQPPQSGRVLLDNRPINTYQRRAIARKIGYLGQSPQAPDGITLRQLVEHGAFSRTRLFQRPSRDAVDRVLDRVGLLSFANRAFGNLSGGERQRGWIALALLQAPGIMLLDEPTTFLDMGYRIEVLRLLEELKTERNLGIVMVLHDINEAARFADRIIALKNGRVLRDGGKAVIDAALMEELFGSQVFVETYKNSIPFIRPDW